MMKITSLLQLYEIIPEHERIIVDVLRQILIEQLPSHCKEKISYNVPFFYGQKSICLIWPSSIPRGGVKEGVLLGFWYGNRLHDPSGYLSHGTNKQIFYKIYKSVDDIDVEGLYQIIQAAIDLDLSWKKK